MAQRRIDMKPMAFRLSDHARRLLRELAELKAISMTDVIEHAIRDAAKREGIK
jgi:predicted transcriptional regulator